MEPGILPARQRAAYRLTLEIALLPAAPVPGLTVVGVYVASAATARACVVRSCPFPGPARLWRRPGVAPAPPAARPRTV